MYYWYKTGREFILRQQAGIRYIGRLICCLTVVSGLAGSFPALSSAAETDRCLDLYETISDRQATAIRDLEHGSPEFFKRIHELENELFVALEQCYQDPLLFSLMAENQVSLNNIQLAYIYASKAQQKRPDLWQTNHALGTALFMQKKYLQGLAFLEKAVQIAPNRSGLHFNLCSSYVAAEQYQQALKSCSTLLALKDHQLHGSVFYQRSLAYKALGKNKQAESDLSKARKLGVVNSSKK